MGMGDDGDAKKRRAMCPSLEGRLREVKGGRIIEAYEESRPAFVVMGNGVERPDERIWEAQVKDMSYAAHIGGITVTASSTQVAPQFKINNMTQDTEVGGREVHGQSTARGTSSWARRRTSACL